MPEKCKMEKTLDKLLKEQENAKEGIMFSVLFLGIGGSYIGCTLAGSSKLSDSIYSVWLTAGILSTIIGAGGICYSVNKYRKCKKLVNIYNKK